MPLGKGGYDHAKARRGGYKLPAYLVNEVKKQKKAVKSLVRANRAEQGWIDSEYTETTINRTPQLISRGVQGTATTAPEFFTMGQGTDGSDKDHKRIGLSINGQRVRGVVRITGRGSASGYPPDVGDKSGSNQVRLLGVIYKTLQDFNTGLAEVLEHHTAPDGHPSRIIDSYFKKQSDTNWKIWLDKKFSVPYTTQTKVVNINYKIPPSYQKMVYPLDTSSPPDTNIMVLYAMSGVRNNGSNAMTVQATYRCTYDK